MVLILMVLVKRRISDTCIYTKEYDKVRLGITWECNGAEWAGAKNG